MLKDPNTITELIVFAYAGTVAVILMQRFHFNLSIFAVRKFGIRSSRTLRWKNTKVCLNCVSYMRVCWRYLVEKITNNVFLLLSSFEAWILFSVVLVSAPML
jgi:hypothetical protein